MLVWQVVYEFSLWDCVVEKGVIVRYPSAIIECAAVVF